MSRGARKSLGFLNNALDSRRFSAFTTANVKAEHNLKTQDKKELIIKYEWENTVTDPQKLEHLRFLVRGNWIVCRAKDKPGLRWFCLSGDLKLFQWSEETGHTRPALQSPSISTRFKHIFRPKHSMPVEQLIRVSRGRDTMALKDLPTSEAENDVLFSLVSDEKTVSFQARTQEERTQFVTAIEAILNSRSGTVSRPFNVKHVSHVDETFRWSGKSVEDTFMLGSEIGRGSFAEVYRAKHRETKFEVAVKILRNVRGHKRASIAMLRRALPEGRDNIEKRVSISTISPVNARADQDLSSQEIDMNLEEVLLLQCRHLNIVSYYGSSRDKNGCLWILTELCELGSVVDLLKTTEKQSLSEEEIVCILRSTLQGIVYLHSQSIVHRDVKGSNILMTREALVKLTDFGVSRQVDSETAGCKTKGAGTLLWMSPEVMNGDAGDAATDIWSLGIVAIELAQNGVAPYSDETLPEALRLLRSGDLPTLPTNRKWSESFHDFVSSCLVRSPTERPVGEMLLKHSVFSAYPTNQSLRWLVSSHFRAEMLQQIRQVNLRHSVHENMEFLAKKKSSIFSKNKNRVRISQKVVLNESEDSIMTTSTSTTTTNDANKPITPQNLSCIPTLPSPTYLPADQT